MTNEDRLAIKKRMDSDDILQGYIKDRDIYHAKIRALGIETTYFHNKEHSKGHTELTNEEKDEVLKFLKLK